MKLPQGAAARTDLFVVSGLVLFLELACIRWFPAHVIYLTFFTNSILLASFLGLSLGCLTASQNRNFLAWTPGVLIVAFITAGTFESLGSFVRPITDVGNQQTPELVFFGTETLNRELAPFVIPIEAICGLFFALTALAMLGPGQELGRALRRVPERLPAYTVNIAGSASGILGFAGLSWLNAPPAVWFALVAAWLFYRLPRHREPGRHTVSSVNRLLAALLPLASQIATIDFPIDLNPNYATTWSPYYRVDYAPTDRSITVNLIGHQQMLGKDALHGEGFVYSLPHVLRRDAGSRPFGDVLIIGAGSGNDVSRALLWGARHVDAVEIDPVIQRLGALHHPDRPYDDLRVSRILDDGRNVLRRSGKSFDLIEFALVDSLILHSGYSNVRLESFLFTRQAFEDVKNRLAPGGSFVIYNYFRQGWIVGKIHRLLEETFGRPPLVFSFPYHENIQPGALAEGGFTMFLAGDTQRIQDAFARSPDYRLMTDRPLSPLATNGFDVPDDDGATRDRYLLRPSRMQATPPPALPSDDWPFLYLREPMIPGLSLRGIGVMALLSLLMFGWLLRRPPEGSTAIPRFRPRFFFLGAGFMLIETKAVVQMALVLGSTWMVNSLVIMAILVMILAANLFVMSVKPRSMAPYYSALFLGLAVNAWIPLDSLLSLPRSFQIGAAALLIGVPIFFAGVIFAASFAESRSPDIDLGVNTAGAMLGGFAEYGSMLFGFRVLVYIAIIFYALSMLTRPEPRRVARNRSA